MGHPSLPNSGLSASGSFDLDLAALPSPGQYTIEVALTGTEWRNTWRIWVMTAAEAPPVPVGVNLSYKWDGATRKLLADGGRVLLLLDPGRLYSALDGLFAPVFAGWQQLPGQPGTFGLHCDPSHPALRLFPTASHSDWQWWDLMRNSAPLILDSMAEEVTPIVREIDNQDRCHQLALLFECRVGPGSLLVCSIDLRNGLKKRPAARQLLASLKAYIASSEFAPASSNEPARLDHLFRQEPLWLEVEQPGSGTPRLLDVRAAGKMTEVNYPDGILTWTAELDEVLEQADGFEYKVGTCSMHCEPRIGLEGWRNRWRIHPLQIELSTPQGFEGAVYLQLLDREQRGGPVWVRLAQETAQPIGFEGYDGRWIRLRIPDGHRGSEPLRIELVAPDSYVWVKRLVICPSEPN